MPAVVPGGVHPDLMASGKRNDPFVDVNELKVQWVAETDWEYKTTFKLDAEMLAQEKVILVADGLDFFLFIVTQNHYDLVKTTKPIRVY